MIVTVLPDKYRCGSNRGVTAYDSPGYLEKLNKVIDFDKSNLPENFSHELKPGNMFLYEGQVFAIDSAERLVLCVTETGAWAIKRFLQDILEGELKLLEPSGIENVKISNEKQPDEDVEVYKPGYYIMKSWRDKVNPEESIKIEFTSDRHIFPVTLWIDGWNIWYNPLWVDPEEIEETTLEALRWFYK